MFNPQSEINKDRFARFTSIIALVALWYSAAFITNDDSILPFPHQVLALIWQEMRNGELWPNLGATLLRVIAAFCIAMTIGTITGIAMGCRRSFQRWLDSVLIIMLNLPALVTIVLCYLWIGLNETAAILAVALNKIPMVTVMLREGARTLDPGLNAMSKLYNVSSFTHIRHIMLPQLAPHMASAARGGIALIWKIVLVVEFLGRSNGIGFQIHLYFQLFDVAMVLAYAFSFIFIMLTIELALMQPLERYARRWRGHA